MAESVTNSSGRQRGRTSHSRRAGVKGVHDLHIWTITSGLDALSAHVVVPVGEDRDTVLGRLQSLLRDRFGIDHVTLQIVEERSGRVQVE